MERYAAPDFAAKARLSDLPSLVKLAWDIALILPELGDDIIDDLCSDITAIVERERPALAEAAQRDASEFWSERLRRTEEQRTDRIAALLPGLTAEGFNPRGYYVYLLWRKKDDEKPVYVGLSSALFARLAAHLANPMKQYEFGWVTFIDCGTEQNMIDTEQRLIAKYQPRLNVHGVRS